MGRAKKDNAGSRQMTAEEISAMEGDTSLPAGYANTTLPETPEEAAPPTTEAAAPAAETPVAPVTTTVTTEKAPTTTTVTTVPPAVSDDTFTRLERELSKEDGKEDLTTFSRSEKAYFHQMRRDRKARQIAEGERDTALFQLTKIKNPPAPPPDPFAGMAEDEVLSVKEAKERLTKMPPVVAPQPVAPAVNAQAKRYLTLCENEARAAHPDDFDIVMELSADLLENDPEALRTMSLATEKGENPAEVMYNMIKKHKEFENLFPAAEVRVKARKSNAVAPTASPAVTVTTANAAPATPQDKAQAPQSATDAEAALLANAARPKTTAHISGKEGKPVEEMTLEDIAGMSDLEFARLPRHVRQRYLKQHGS